MDAERLAAIRGFLQDRNLDAWLQPRADEYLGEYVPPQNERLLWLTGFTGSAGMAAVTLDTAALFIDGRYTEQAATQVDPALFERRHLLEEPPLAWLGEQLSAGARVGIDSRLHTFSFFTEARNTLADHGIEVVELTTSPVDANWQDRPVAMASRALLLGEKQAGESSTAKRARIGASIKAAGATHAIISQLDAIAWLLNIRGQDVPHLPVVLGTALLDADGALTFFTDPAKFDNEFPANAGPGVELRDETDLPEILGAFGDDQSILVDASQCNAFVMLRCQESRATVVTGTDPTLIPKAKKNDTELAGIRACHVRDGAAVSRYLHWLETQVAARAELDEAMVADKLREFRDLDPTLVDLSFSTISAAGANAAMPHYNHNNGTPARLLDGELYLVDSGGQYPDGTTDITRTVALGTCTAEHRANFTRVLKGHIALARAVFPRGTTGVQLDVLARQFLWQAGLDYDHGTGHGVGCFLSVHEGPQRIGKVPVANGNLLPGMVISNEPGYYHPGGYGIRCENLVVVIERSDGYLAFETITFAPFDQRLVDISLMSADEIDWLNTYHGQVREKLATQLAGSELEWLTAATHPLEQPAH